MTDETMSGLVKVVHNSNNENITLLLDHVCEASNMLSFESGESMTQLLKTSCQANRPGKEAIHWRSNHKVSGISGDAATIQNTGGRNY